MPLRLVVVFPVFIALAAVSAPHATLIAQPSAQTIAGAWVLNPALTQRPEEIGFTPEWARAPGSGERGGGSAVPLAAVRFRGRRHGVPASSRETVDDSTRVEQLTGDARTPPSRLTIIQKDSAIAIADDQGHVRTFRPDGHLEELTIGTVPLPTTARWDWPQPRRGLQRRARPAATLHVHVVGRSHAVASEHSVPRSRAGRRRSAAHLRAGGRSRPRDSVGSPGVVSRAVSVSLDVAWRSGRRDAICASFRAAARIRSCAV